jgi:hypothetical protein
MTNTVFSMFQTQYILDFLSASRIVEHWDFPNTEISSLKMSRHIHVFNIPVLLRLGVQSYENSGTDALPAPLAAMVDRRRGSWKL